MSIDDFYHSNELKQKPVEMEAIIDVEHDEEDDAFELDFMPKHSNASSFLTYELFSTIIPEHKYHPHLEKSLYEELAKNAFKWDEFFELCKYKLFTLADFIHNEYFYNMIAVHAKLQTTKATTTTSSEGILPVLKDLMSRKVHFLIPFVYVTNYVPKRLKKINLLFFGITDKYPELIDKTKKEIEASNKPMKSVKDILKTYHVLYESPTFP
jgi:hypothetical protein